MNHQKRVELYKQYMAAEGVRMNAAAPPFWEVVWTRGIELPPPPFLSPVILGLFGALAMAAVPAMLWLLTLFKALLHPISGHSMPWLWAAFFAAAAGLFGLVALPVYYHRMAKRHGLVQWVTFAGIRQHN